MRKPGTQRGALTSRDVNGALDAAVKEKLDHYQHDYNELNFFSSSSSKQSRRPPGESAETFSVCFTYCLTAKQQTTSHAWASLLDPSPQAFKERRGSYFCYNRAAIGLACAQATAMRIDIAPHKRPRQKPPHHVPDPHHFHIPPHAHLHD